MDKYSSSKSSKVKGLIEPINDTKMSGYTQQSQSPLDGKRHTIESMDSAYYDDVTEDSEDYYEPLANVHQPVITSGQIKQVNDNLSPASTLTRGSFQTTNDGGMFFISPINCTFIIPNNAVEQARISVTEINDQQEKRLLLNMFRDSILLSDVFELTPHGQRFKEEITLKFPVKNPSSQSKQKGSRVLIYSPVRGDENSQWVPITGNKGDQIDSGILSWCILGKYCYVSLRHFCKLAAIHQDDEEEKYNDSPSRNVDAGDDNGHQSDQYEYIDSMMTQHSDVIDDTGLEQVEAPYVALSVEKVTKKMFDLVLTFSGRSDAIEDTMIRRCAVIDSQKVLLDSCPVQVKLNLHNTEFKLRSGDKPLKIIQPKESKLRYFLELNGKDSSSLCELSFGFREEHTESIWARIACFCQTHKYDMATTLRMDKTMKELQTMEQKIKSQNRLCERYIKDPTEKTINKHEYEYTDVMVTEKTTSQPQDEYANQFIINEQDEPVSSIYESQEDFRQNSQPLLNNEMQHAQPNITGITSTNSHTNSQIYMNVSDIIRNVDTCPVYENLNVDTNSNLQLIVINHVENMAVNTECDTYDDEGIYANSNIIIERKDDKLVQNSAEFTRFLQAEIPGLLKGSLMDTLHQYMQSVSHKLTPKFILDVCLADEEFEMIQKVCMALESSGKSKMVSKVTWEIQKELLRRKMEHIADRLKVQEIYGKMYSRGLMSTEQKNDLQSRRQEHEKALYFIQNIVLKLNQSQFEEFVEVLGTTEQRDIVEMFRFQC